MLALALAAAALLPSVHALPDGLARTPPMGFNSWTAYGTGVSEDALRSVADFFVSSGMAKAGYTYVNSDDGWSNYSRSSDGLLQADASKFPSGLSGVAAYIHSKGLKFGIYSAASSVVCSGRPGSLYNEYTDAAWFVSQGVDYIKYDNCGEYTLGNRRFDLFADAVAATGKPVVISTEPFSLWPNPSQGGFSHLWRTGDDINSNWGTILDRIDRNSKWWMFGGPGGWCDPDMLQVGNGQLTIEQDRSHFGLWAISKSPLILGSPVEKLSPAQLAIVTNPGVIAVNQDPLGVQGRKLAVNGQLVPNFVGLASCYYADSKPGFNGVTAAGMTWHPQPLGTINGTSAFALVNNGTGRCLGLRQYMGRTTPLLVPCTDPVTDPTQAWSFPTGAQRVGGLQSLYAVWAAGAGQNPSNGTVLGVGNSTLYGAVHGKDDMPLLDMAYGYQTIGLAPYTPEPPCNNRNCQNYDPTQSWTWSPRTGKLGLAHAAANLYRCYEGPCYQLTDHLPASDEWCLSAVSSISNDPIDPSTSSTGGVDVWGGPLSGGAYVFGLLNRNGAGSGAANITAAYSMLETPGMGDTTSACVRELFTDTQLGVFTGSVTVAVQPYDLAVLRVVPGATSC